MSTMDNLLMLVIVDAYFRMMLALCFIAGQLLIFVIEALADWVERRQERKRAFKRAKAMQNRKKLERQRAFAEKRRERARHTEH